MDRFQEDLTTDDTQGPGRKARIAIMGEFSAGKTTLANLLMGAPTLPVKVTATQLPPVWLSHGEADPFRISLDGEETPVDLSDLSDIPLADTQFLRVFRQSDVLERIDLIDMPGISDPNMPADIWERVAHFADGVIWCTHAMQAWRQSEAAVWETFPDALFERSLLLLTRIDKITSDRDRQRLRRRVERETEGLFRRTFPISLTEAQAADAEQDFERWQTSGADAFATELLQLAEAFEEQGDTVPETFEPRSAAPKPVAEVVPVVADGTRIMPRRIRVRA